MLSRLVFFTLWCYCELPDLIKILSISLVLSWDLLKKNKKTVKVGGKPIVAQEIESEEVKEVDLHSLSLGECKKKSLPSVSTTTWGYLPCSFEVLRWGPVASECSHFLGLKGHRFTRNRYVVYPFLGQKKTSTCPARNQGVSELQWALFHTWARTASGVTARLSPGQLCIAAAQELCFTLVSVNTLQPGWQGSEGHRLLPPGISCL